MNIIKNVLSNRMLVQLVSAILTIKDSDWTLENELLTHEDKILAMFNSQKNRRGAYKIK